MELEISTLRKKIIKSNDSIKFKTLFFIRPDQLQRANEFDCNWLVLDLQDSVPLHEKEEVRHGIKKFLENDFQGLVHKSILLRVNEIENWSELQRDLLACVNSNVNALLLPMIDNEDDVRIFDKLISRIEREQNLTSNYYKFICLIETPAAVLNAYQIAQASKRNIALSFGHGDFLNLTLGYKIPEALFYAKSKIVVAARAQNLEVVDSPFMEIKDSSGFRRECEMGKKMGFSGKFIIHPNQLYIANKIFSINSDEYKMAKKILSNENQGCFIEQDTMLGPPFLKRLKRNFAMGEYLYNLKDFDGIYGSKMDYGLDMSDAFPSKEIYSPYELTINEAWITLWQSFTFTPHFIEASSLFCKQLTLPSLPIPYTLLLALSLCMCVEILSENSLAHIEILDAVYENFSYPGETFRCKTIINDINYLNNRGKSIVTSSHFLVNSKNEKIFSVKKLTMFLGEIIQKRSEVDTSGNAEAPHRFIRDFLIDKSDNLSQYQQAMFARKNDFQSNQLIIHNDVRTIGNSEVNLFNSLFHNTHPLHSNRIRYQDKIIPCGLQILPMVLGISDRDFPQILYQEITRCIHINPVYPNDNLSSFSYIKAITKVNVNLQEILAITFGLKNIESSKLLDFKFPNPLFSDENIFGSHYEKICNEYIPVLNNLIILVCHRKILVLSNKNKT